MPAPLVGGLLWGIGSILGAILPKLFDFVFKFVAAKWAWRITLGTGIVLAAAGVTIGMALAVKALIIGARVTMPASLGASTYFLPSNINLIIAAYITFRLIHFIHQWTLKNMERFFQQSL